MRKLTVMIVIWGMCQAVLLPGANAQIQAEAREAHKRDISVYRARIAEDNRMIEADRQSLKDARRSGDKAGIAVARRKLKHDVFQKRADIREAGNIRIDRERIVEDNRIIEADRQEVREARQSGDRTGVIVARRKLSNDIRRKEADIVDLKRAQRSLDRDVGELARSKRHP